MTSLVILCNYVVSYIIKNIYSRALVARALVARALVELTLVELTLVELTLRRYRVWCGQVHRFLDGWCRRVPVYPCRRACPLRREGR